MKEQIKETNNIIKISDDKKERDYLYSTSIRMRPRIYDKYNCIIWEIIGCQLNFAKNILFENHCKYWGLEIESEEKVKLKAVTERGSGYTLPDGYRIVLKKIPPIKHIE